MKYFATNIFLTVHFGELKQFCEMKSPIWMLLGLVLPGNRDEGNEGSFIYWCISAHGYEELLKSS